MVVGVILGTIFVFSGLGFLIGKAAEALAEEPPIIEIPIIEDVPPDEIEEIDVIIPGGGEVLITQVGL